MPIRKRKSNPTQFDDITSKITPVAERPEQFSILVYGRSGTGKTAFASTFPKPMLLLDVKEKGTDTIAKVPGIDVLAVEEWSEIEQVYWYLKSSESKYKTVVIDQVSQMQDICMSHVRADSHKEETDLLSRKDWGQISGLMKTWLYNYRDLIDSSMHVVFVAHERATEGDDSVEDQIDPSIGPRLMPSLASAVNGAVSVIANTFVREEYSGSGKDKERAVKYCMRIGAHAYYVTKIRRPVDFEAPEFIVNPTFERIQSILRGEKPAPKKKVHK